MAAAAVFHQPQRFDRHLARGHRVGIRCHNLGQRRADRAFSFCEHPVNGITAGKNTHQTAIAVCDQDSADAAVAHTLAGLPDRSARRKRERVLVSHNVGHLSHISSLLTAGPPH